MTNQFTSARLSFAPMEVADVSDAYVAWLNDPEISQFLETRHSEQTRESCLAFVQGCADDPRSHLFKMVLTETGQHIGNIKIGPVDMTHQTGALSLLIGEASCHGRGLATEAIDAVTGWAFQELGLARVEAGCYDANTGSLRAFIKAGYEVEGFFRKSRIDANGQRVGLFWMARLRDT